MEPVNERSQCKVTLTFYDESGVLVTPTRLDYNIKDVYSATTIRTVTSVTPSTTSYTITVLSAENRIVDATRQSEMKKVSAEWYSGAVIVGTGDYTYEVINKYWVPLSAVSASPSESPSASVSPSVSPSPSA